jgi:hypothetical protein
MTPEILLLLIVVIVAPLIQQLLRAIRHQRPPYPTTGQACLPAPAHPRVSGIASPRLTHTAAPESAVASMAAAATPVPVAPGHRSSRRGGVLTGLRTPAGLRRTFVLMMILGPCRAIDPFSHSSSPTSAKPPHAALDD